MPDDRQFHRLRIEASEPTTSIWVVADDGYLVSKQDRLLDVSLRPGEYFVLFSLSDREAYRIQLEGALDLDEAHVRQLPASRPPVPVLDVPAVRKRLDTSMSADAAFDVFTRVQDWWPFETHSVSGAGPGAPPVSARLEPSGIYEVTREGERIVWGDVVEWEPTRNLVLRWYPGTETSLATTVGVHFADKEDGGSAVFLEHYGWGVFEQDAEEVRNRYNSGWEHVFVRCFGSAVSGQRPTPQG